MFYTICHIVCTTTTTTPNSIGITTIYSTILFITLLTILLYIFLSVHNVSTAAIPLLCESVIGNRLQIADHQLLWLPVWQWWQHTASDKVLARQSFQPQAQLSCLLVSIETKTIFEILKRCLLSSILSHINSPVTIKLFDTLLLLMFELATYIYCQFNV